MPITKEVVVDQIEATASRIIQIRFRKNIVEDGKVISFEYHRAVLEPGSSLAAQMASVNQHFTQMGWPACTDTSRIEAIVRVEHTPDAVQAYRAERYPPKQAKRSLFEKR